jgi:hypothetical protein
VLNKSKSKISASIAVKKISMISLNMNMVGLKIPLRATSIIPFADKAPTKTPKEATVKIILKVATFEPTAEPTKFAASFATPTIRSEIAKRNKTPTMMR